MGKQRFHFIGVSNDVVRHLQKYLYYDDMIRIVVLLQLILTNYHNLDHSGNDVKLGDKKKDI